MTTYTTNYNLDKYEGTDKPNLRDQYNSAMDKIDTELKDLADADVQTSTNVLNLQNRMNTAESDITDLQTTDASFTQQISGINTSISSIDTRLGTAESNITDLQNADTSFTQQISGIDTRLGTAESNITDLQSSLTTTKEGISNLETTVEDIGLGVEVATIQPNSSTGVPNLTASGTLYIRRNSKLHIANVSFYIHVKNSSSSPVALPADTILYHAPTGWEPSTDRSIGQGSLYINAATQSIGVNNIGLKANGDISLNYGGSVTIPANSECIFCAFQPLLFTESWGNNY